MSPTPHNHSSPTPRQAKEGGHQKQGALQTYVQHNRETSHNTSRVYTNHIPVSNVKKKNAIYRLCVNISPRFPRRVPEAPAPLPTPLHPRRPRRLPPLAARLLASLGPTAQAAPPPLPPYPSPPSTLPGQRNHQQQHRYFAPPRLPASCRPRRRRRRFPPRGVAGLIARGCCRCRRRRKRRRRWRRRQRRR